MPTPLGNTEFPENPPAARWKQWTPLQGGNAHPLFASACGEHILSKKLNPAFLARSLTKTPNSVDICILFTSPFHEKLNPLGRVLVGAAARASSEFPQAPNGVIGMLRASEHSDEPIGA